MAAVAVLFRRELLWHVTDINRAKYLVQGLAHACRGFFVNTLRFLLVDGELYWDTLLGKSLSGRFSCLRRIQRRIHLIGR